MDRECDHLGCGARCKHRNTVTEALNKETAATEAIDAAVRAVLDMLDYKPPRDASVSKSYVRSCAEAIVHLHEARGSVTRALRGR